MIKRKLTSSDTVVVASHNTGKIREIRELLAPFDVAVSSAVEKNLPEPEETGTTFEANALLKAKAAAMATGLPSLSDDSGLEVEALQGAPGIYSARWAGPTKDFSVGMEKIYQSLINKKVSFATKPKANFTCSLCLCWPDGEFETYLGKVFGHLVWPPRGDKGFGYDPMFVAEGYDLTFGEIEPKEKHSISHRAKAFELFVTENFTRSILI